MSPIGHRTAGSGTSIQPRCVTLAPPIGTQRKTWMPQLSTEQVRTGKLRHSPAYRATRAATVPFATQTARDGETFPGVAGFLRQMTCRPHSVRSDPRHRPDLGSSASPTGVVQGMQPMDGYPRLVNGFTGMSWSAM